MTDGPIEFVSAKARDTKGPTEFGGVSGLLAPETVSGVAGHEMTGSEKRGVLVRSRAATKVNALTGFVEPDETKDAVDDFTGRVVDPAWNEDGASGKPVDVPPQTGDPRAATL